MTTQSFTVSSLIFSPPWWLYVLRGTRRRRVPEPQQGSVPGWSNLREPSVPVQRGDLHSELRQPHLWWALPATLASCTLISDPTTLSEWVPAGSPSCGGDVTVYVGDISQPSLPTPFYSVLASVSVFTALSTVFYSMNSPDNSPFSHSVVPVLSLPYYWSFWAIHLFMKVSVSPDIIPSGWLGSEHQLAN